MTIRPSVASRASNMPWIWSLLGSLILWIGIGIVSSRFNLQTLTINATLATFLAIIGLGQMTAITGGGGGIDLSIPYVVTLSAFLSAGLMRDSNGLFLYGMGITLAVGLLIGLFNGIIIVWVKVPPIVATLATGFIVDSAGLVYAHGFSSSLPSPILTNFVTGTVAGVPLMIVGAMMVALVLGGVFRKMIYGRSLLAVGQSNKAARYAGVPVTRVILISYAISSVLAALGGSLLGAYTGGAFLNMGNPYLLTSIGAVVIGGTLISGGRSTIIGTLGGALFLTLVVTLMEASKMAIGVQDMVEGVLVIGVLLASRILPT